MLQLRLCPFFFWQCVCNCNWKYIEFIFTGLIIRQVSYSGSEREGERESERVNSEHYHQVNYNFLKWVFITRRRKRRIPSFCGNLEIHNTLLPPTQEKRGRISCYPCQDFLPNLSPSPSILSFFLFSHHLSIFLSLSFAISSSKIKPLFVSFSIPI